MSEYVIISNYMNRFAAGGRLEQRVYDEKQKERLEQYALFQDFKAQLMVLVSLLLVLIYVNSVNIQNVNQ